MKNIIRAVLICSAVSIAAVPAMAGVGIAVDFGDVSVGYRDGYWDGQHHWHKWHHANDWKSYRDTHRDHYRDYNHDRDEHHDH